MSRTNGSGLGMLEAWEQPESVFEDESFESFEQPESVFEDESFESFEQPESVFEDESFESFEDEAWESPAAFESWESPEATHESWGQPESVFEDESWEQPEAWESHEGTYEERDQFLPFLLPLAAKALPMLARAAVPAIRRLMPVASRAVSGVVRSVLAPPSGTPGVGRPFPGMSAQQLAMIRARNRAAAMRRARLRAMQGGGGGGWAPQPAAPSYAPEPVPAPQGGGIPPEILGLLRQLSGVLAQGESSAEQHESQMFGESAMQGELAGNEVAHEAALAEVLAAEAAHTRSDAEAGALLGAALPITIRVMGAQRVLRPVLPALAASNANLVRGIRVAGPNSRQLVRLVPTIQRRTVATLGAMQRSGRPVTPSVVAPVMAAQAARVLRTPRICGPAIARNVAVRKATVAPVRR